MRWRVLWFAVFAAIALLAGAGFARAQATLPTSPPSTDPAPNAATNDAKARAQEHLDRGNALFKEHSFEKALAEFRAAYDSFRSPKILYNEADAEFALGRFAAAAAHYDAFLREFSEPEDEEDAQRIQAAKESAAAARAKIAIIEPDASLSAGQRVRLAPDPIAFRTEVPPPSPPKPMWRRWPFWAIAGAAIVAGVATVFVVDYYSRPSCPGTAICTQGD